jgi:hypothetical protein
MIPETGLDIVVRSAIMPEHVFWPANESPV